MLNRLHAALHSPYRGWDPVAPSHIAAYAAYAFESFDTGITPMLETKLGPLAGKRILDLGGGPGYYGGNPYYGRRYYRY